MEGNSKSNSEREKKTSLADGSTQKLECLRDPANIEDSKRVAHFGESLQAGHQKNEGPSATSSLTFQIQKDKVNVQEGAMTKVKSDLQVSVNQNPLRFQEAQAESNIFMSVFMNE